MSDSFLIDVHAHLHDEKFGDEQPQLIENAVNAGVKRIVNAATCEKTSQQAVDLAEKFDPCFATAGIHPHDASSFGDKSVARLTELATHKKVLAIGEIGLDFHYDFSPRNVQENVFETLYSLAAELKMPAIIHVREAFDRFFPIISGLPMPPGVLLHCFSGNIDVARKATDLGFHFSVGGALTFPKSEIAREVFSWLPPDVIHLETDCPYLAPQPKRGKRNEPALIPLIFDFLADLRKVSKESLKKQLMQNAVTLFGKELIA